MNQGPKTRRLPLLGLIPALYLGVYGTGAEAATYPSNSHLPDGMATLYGVPTPPVPGLRNYVRNKHFAELLGKALFWDMQVGSDGQACASCHFAAGADNRAKNQLSPGILAGDTTFDATASGGGGPNYTLTQDDFPFHQLSNPLDRDSAIDFTTNDVASSMGVFHTEFVQLVNGGKDEESTIVHPDGANFFVDDQNGPGVLNVRRVEPRNTPTVINAIFNFRNFWDGRANNVCNGVDPFGRRNDDAKVFAWDRYTNSLVDEEVHLINSSAASQAVGPPLSFFEMSCDKKGFHHIGRKMLKRKPLALQKVHPDDSLLGKWRAPGKGLKISYKKLIEYAFNKRYWGSSDTVTIGGEEYTQMEANFSLFWGLAIQLYEATLVSDRTPFDSFARGSLRAMTDAQKRGMEIFADQGKCVNCHAGPEFTKAATHLIGEDEEEGLVERMFMSDNQLAVYDNGFYNIGVTPTDQDIGVGGEGPFGHPLSFTRQALDVAGGGDAPDPFEVDHTTFEENPHIPLNPNEDDAVDGAFKVSGLRNIELTGPYMHNGSMSTLKQVVEFYNRGGNVRSDNGGDTSGSPARSSNLDPDITPLGLTEAQQNDLVEFLKALTDERVRWEKAPFDHPQLFVPNGSPGDQNGTTADGTGLQGIDDMFEVPAVGRNGRTPAMGPVKNFLEP